MPYEVEIKNHYKKIGNHRTVAEKLNLPIHYVMWILGLMPQALFDVVNG